MGFKLNNSGPDFDYNTWIMAHAEPEQSKTSRFVTLSASLHGAAIILATMFTGPLIDQVQTETITIEIEEPAPAPVRKASRGVPTIATQGGAPKTAKTMTAQNMRDIGGPDDVLVKAAPTKGSSSRSAAKSAKDSPAKTNFKAVPMTIDDIEAPELDQGQLAAMNKPSSLNTDFDDDFASVDQNQLAALETEKNALESMANSLTNEQDETLAALNELHQNEADQLASMQNDLRRRNAEKIASALAAEKAAALAAAKQAKASRQNGLGGQGNGYGVKAGAGAGNSGQPTYNKQLAGVPQGVRSLDQLRQMPGNPKPQYDREERRRGDQGEIAFVAYISKQGQPTQFKLLKSTGFKNLDAKTLSALKKWRFYPGQEGWVELPFRWDLKGGVVEDGGTLRRSVSQR